MMGISLEGTWKVILTDGTAAQMHLPGTLGESGIGHRDDISISNAVLEFLSVCPRFKYKMPHKAEPPFCCPQTQSFSLGIRAWG